MGLRNGNVHVGSAPGLLTLLGMNLSGKAAPISQPTCANVTKIANTTNLRYPRRFRYKNLSSIALSTPATAEKRHYHPVYGLSHGLRVGTAEMNTSATPDV